MPAYPLIQMVVIGAGVAVCAWLSFVSMKNWQGDRYLCDDCVFNNSEDCHKAERPRALQCGVYRRRLPDLEKRR